MSGPITMHDLFAYLSRECLKELGVPADEAAELFPYPEGVE